MISKVVYSCQHKISFWSRSDGFGNLDASSIEWPNMPARYRLCRGVYILVLSASVSSKKMITYNTHVIDEGSAADIVKESISLSARFHSFGMVLGLPTSELDKIREDFPHSSDQSFSRVIDAWLKQLYDTSRHGCPSWKKLCEAVDSEAGGKNPALAMRIATAHQGTSISLTLGGGGSCVFVCPSITTLAAT